MSYSKQTWANGDIITASKLNHMEDGIEAVETELTDDYARTDGAYESMTVGNAEQLIATVSVSDKVPYNFRTAGGSADIGDRLTEKIVGGTIAWNQLAEADANAFSNNGGTKTYDSTINTYTVTLTTAMSNLGLYSRVYRAIIGHKYLVRGKVKPSVSGNISFGVERNTVTVSVTADVFNDVAVVSNATESKAIVFYSAVNGLEEYTADFKDLQFFDLTQMFGSTIADYIYTLETNTAGAGVAWFKKLFPKPYYAYDSGSLQSVKTSAHKTVGFNAWDEEWMLGTFNADHQLVSGSYVASKNPIPITPSTTYYSKCSANIKIEFYTSGMVWVSEANVTSNSTFTTPATASYMLFRTYAAYGTTYLNDICINLSWDGERDGEYEAYVQHTYALDSDLELRGIPKLDANNSLYYDGDTYESDGTVTRKYGVVDLGALDWSTAVSAGITRFRAPVAGIKRVSLGTELGQILCSNYATKTANQTYTGKVGISVQQNTDDVYIYDPQKEELSASDFKAAMSGVQLVYELATPTTESADSFQSPQIVDDFGTEEYVDAAVAANTRDVAVPVGHDTNYQANLRAKLEMAPDSPDSNGDYIVRHNNGENTYVPITFPADELPAAPTEDGDYVLKCTVADGAATFTWASAT